MTRCSIQPGDHIFVKRYRSLYFAKSMGKNIDENMKKLKQ